MCIRDSPGIYELNGRLNTVRELVNESQGLTGDAFLNRAVLYRQREDPVSYTHLDVYKRQEYGWSDKEILQVKIAFFEDIKMNPCQLAQLAGALRFLGTFL